ncbi:MAG: TetR/AcrR family transcriptional regulator [Caulobacteraceae bacterium]|nr:TetR/AcrR family transcriptional regulator [Caulobacteraceae bacterium]
MLKGEPRWRRRKEARPAEIVAAALEVFAEKGFAAARLDEIARRAGVSKGALYLYYETKEDIFHAVVTQTVTPRLAQVRAMADGFSGRFADLVPTVLATLARVIPESPAGPIVKMIVGESRNFPQLARYWHDEAILPMVETVGGLVAAAQARGEVRAGDPRLFAFQLAGPMLMGVLWREVFTPVGAEPVDFQALARQHAETLLAGMLMEKAA